MLPQSHRALSILVVACFCIAALLAPSQVWADDCNGNSMEDWDEIMMDPGLDCDNNGMLDECEGYPPCTGSDPCPWSPDCNSNGIGDECEGVPDCNWNGMPDTCEWSDCNANGQLDECDARDGYSQDCNSNMTPDECESMNDCNGNGTADECEDIPDCNSNGLPDTCDPDSDSDGHIDACDNCPQASNPEQEDANGDGIGDACPVAAATTVRMVSVSTAGALQNGNTSNDGYDISSDGRYVAFCSAATNLVSGDVNGKLDIFIRDRQAGTTTLASLANNGAQANQDSRNPSISSDGRYVAFESYAALVDGDTNGAWDIFVRDRQSNTTTRVSVSSSGVQGNSQSYKPSISADGRFVAFESSATNLVTGDTNSRIDIFVHDRQLATTTRVSVKTDGTQANNHCYDAKISGNGLYVVFMTGADMVDGSSYNNLYLRDLSAGTTSRASRTTGGAAANGACYLGDISADGRYIAFHSDASNLVAQDTDSQRDVYLYDRQANTNTLISVNSSGQKSTAFSGIVSLSDDGRFVAFASNAANLVSASNYGVRQVYLRDVQSGTTTLVSADSAGQVGWLGGSYPAISGNGLYLSFISSSKNLVPGDTNSRTDTFVRILGMVDCNENGVADDQDISAGTSQDTNGNGVPDECETIVDPNDCDDNGIDDSIEIANDSTLDCNQDQVLDQCQWQDCNNNSILDECEELPDCNGNNIPDSCDIAFGQSTDCDGNGVPDSCETTTWENDCNGNGVLDVCEWEDCNNNSVLDVCEMIDCNNNQVHDDCDIANGYADCNNNGTLDECEVHWGGDCDHNMVLDECEWQDCNNNGTHDICEVMGGTGDCNYNGIPDDCDIAEGEPDCNQNGVPDSCDTQWGGDCDSNGTPDECEWQDCDGNGTLDACDMMSGANDCNYNGLLDSCEWQDCNNNELLDECDISNGSEQDCNSNGVPDSCEQDFDQDGTIDGCDNCPHVENSDQADSNGNGVGDACESGSPPVILTWQTLVTHGSTDVPLELSPDRTSSDLGDAGPVVESRRQNLDRLQIVFDQPVQSVGQLGPGVVAVTDHNNVVYVPESVTLNMGTTGTVLTITFNPALPDGKRYNFELVGTFVGTTSSLALVGDTDCQVRVLTGDANGDGQVNLVDIAAIRSRNRQSVTSANAIFDVNNDGQINMIDVALTRSRTGSAAP